MPVRADQRVPRPRRSIHDPEESSGDEQAIRLRRPRRRADSPPKEKRFERRDSLLIKQFDADKKFQGIAYFWITQFVIFFVTIVYEEVTVGGEWYMSYILKYSFPNFQVAIYIWMFMFGMTCGVGVIFNIIIKPLLASFRNPAVWSPYIIIAHIVFLYVPSFIYLTKALTHFDLHLGSAAFLVIEMFRLVMKSHSYIRTVVPRVALAYNSYEKKKLGAPQSFMYFLFAPTLIYRDTIEYPRTKKIRIGWLLYWFVEAILVLCFIAYFVDTYVLLNEDYGKFLMQPTDFFLFIRKNCLLGMVLLCLTFYLVIHTIQNFFAELLRFGDRHFYKDWWSRSRIQEYHRSFNIIVHDWIYQYIYRDLYLIDRSKSKYLGVIGVYSLVLVVHWYAATYILGFAFPVIYCWLFMYFLSIVEAHPDPDDKWTWNRILFLFWKVFYAGFFVSFYGVEYYARKNKLTDVIEKPFLQFDLPVAFDYLTLDLFWLWLCDSYGYCEHWGDRRPETVVIDPSAEYVERSERM